MPRKIAASRDQRRGTVLFYCIVLTSIMAILAYAFLRSVQQTADAGTSSQKAMLAQGAALAGRDHAIEQILTDYVANSVSVAKAGGGTATISPAIQYLDGRWRSTFVEFANPQVLVADYNAPTADNDVRFENQVPMPMVDFGGHIGMADYYQWWYASVYDGRGRFFEPEYYNRTPLAPPALAPVAGVKFLDPAAAAGDRAEGLWYDDNFNRIDTGNAVNDRAAARYRLRYAVGVEDLCGHLLENPKLDFDDSRTNPANDYRWDYRTPPTAMTQWQNAWFNMAGTFNARGSDAAPERWEHVFQGRGGTSNFDQSAVGGFPVTFPLMYRRCEGANNLVQNPSAPLPCYDWGKFTEPNSPFVRTKDLYRSASVTGSPLGGEPLEWLNRGNSGERFYWGSTNGVGSVWVNYPMTHVLTGPQYSWLSTYYALGWGGLHVESNGSQMSFNEKGAWSATTTYYGGDGVIFGGLHYVAYGNNANNLNQQPDVSPGYWQPPDSRGDGSGFSMPSMGHPEALLLVTPFGKGLQVAANPASPAQWKWYEGRVATPWYVNVMTAPPQAIEAMLLAYLPPRLKIAQFTQLSWTQCTGFNGGGYPVYAPAPSGTAAIKPINMTIPGRDLFVKTMSPAGFAVPVFSDWDPPTRPMATPPDISPDYWIPDPRSATAAYPGPLTNGDPAQNDQGADDMGLHIGLYPRGSGVQNQGVCTHTGGAFIPKLFQDETTWSPSAFPYETYASGPNAGQQVPPPATWNGSSWNWVTTDAQNRTLPSIATLSIDPAHPYQYTNSYRWTLTVAMTNAIAFMRAQWVQYPTSHGDVNDPANMFQGTVRNPAAFVSIRDLDKQFLAELGEDIDHPGNGSIVPGVQCMWTSTGWAMTPLTAQNNIRTLVTNDLLKESNVSSIERAKVMELMLNDMRMSFLGSSPQYSDAVANEFRPLDFDGDGQVECSSYPANPAASPTEKKYMTAHWLPASSGQGPKPDDSQNSHYFSLTGCFFTGKSHYFRIMTRGELWDNVLNKALDNATLESVLSVDPEGNGTLDPHSHIQDSQLLFERWHYNRYRGLLPLNAK